MFNKLVNKVKNLSGLVERQDKNPKTQQHEINNDNNTINNNNTLTNNIVADPKEMEKGIKNIMEDNSK